jgi:UDP-2,3-diacylglucosamine pyrophosphatase LpxH
MTKQEKINTIWLSDIHLGNPNCQYKKLYNFLKSLERKDGSYQVKKVFLVGDIIDMTRFNHRIFWSQHRMVIKKLFRMADKGVEIVYIRGNHDHFLEEEFLKNSSPYGVNFNGITIKYNDIHVTKKNEKFFILHGDEFDGFFKAYKIFYLLGSLSYASIIIFNRIQNKIRRLLGFKEWSLAQWIKLKVKRSIQFINKFEDLVVDSAKSKGVHGVICGHIHYAEDKMIDDVRYLNCGCWVEFCSYLYEDKEGNIKLAYYD